MVKIAPVTMTELNCNCGPSCLHTVVSRANSKDDILNILRNADQSILWKKDNVGRTPLHLAADIKQSDLALECSKVLIEAIAQYSDKCKFVNMQEHFKMTALFYASERCHANVIIYLIQNGADVRLTDKDCKSVLHIIAEKSDYNSAVSCAEVIIESADLLDEKIKSQLLNQKASLTSRNAAHLSAIAGNDRLLRYLVNSGTDILETDSFEYTLLHLSVLNAFDEKASRCTQVLMSVGEPQLASKSVLLNMKDKFGRGSLHIAARRGNHSVIDILLRNGANILLQEEKSKSTVLHLAASLGNEEKASLCVETALKSVENLSEEDKQFFVNVKNVNGLTALYLSAKFKNVEACKKLLTDSKFDVPTRRNKTPLEKVYRNIPEAMVVQLEKAVLNSGYTSRPGAIDTYALIDFGPILGYDTTNDNLYKETEELAKIRYAKFDSRQAVLNHLFVRIFVWTKWQDIWWIFSISRFIHILWFVLNFLLLVGFYRSACPYITSTHFSWHSLRPDKDAPHNSTTLAECDKSGFLPWGAALNLIAVLIYVLGLFHPMKQRFHWYFKPVKIATTFSKPGILVNWWKSIWHYAVIWFKILPLAELTCAVFILITTLPILGVYLFSDPVHYALAGVMGFVTWFFVYLEIGRIPQCGVYINLLKQASKTLGFAILVHLPILFGFAAVFVLLMQRMPSFSSLSQALVKILTLMIGELDYQGLIYGDKEDTLLFAGIEMLAIGIFVLFVAIVVLNFLIGLAADDIKGFRERAEIWKLCAQIEQIVLLESFLDNSLPVGKYLLKQLMLMPPRKVNQKLQQVRKAEIHIPDLPKDMQKELHNLNLPTLQSK